MNTWFTSDTHFSHANIIQYQERPFSDTDSMDEEMIRRWNERVQAEDAVYHLGDFALTNKERSQEILNRLRGRKYVLRGNHDRKWLHRLEGWQGVDNYMKIRVEGKSIILCHYPIERWEKCHYGSLHLHGHCHGGLTRFVANRIDVGVDEWDFRPVNLTEILARLSEREPQELVEHHGESHGTR